MPSELAPRLSHVGLYVHDVPKMIDFYTKTLGFVVSDGAEDGRITFLSRNPSDHHQVVLVRGQVIVENDELVGQPGAGQFVRRARFGKELATQKVVA